ncbi:MAG: ATP-dependent zinc metalloprotease FtsH [Bacteroidetes bacterium]|nr:ATP-dependent zinc metalloprotease FtsH [Bacteroidota bacterium]MBU1717835.1 ATP-dependent zinc metalloprotease FtsH [Bacteroidota bacterium]
MKYEKKGKGAPPPPRPKNYGQKSNKPKLSFYWIYAIIAVVFIALQFMNWSGETSDINWQEFKVMIEKKDVSKIVVVNDEVAEIYIKKEKLADTSYREVREQGMGATNTGPHYQYRFLTMESFQKDLEVLQNEINTRDTTGLAIAEKAKVLTENSIIISPETRRDWTGELLGWVIPIAVFVIIWLYIMRRMGGGAGGGGQIFNFGKSKATLFDKNSQVSVTFEDVAGLEEAKVEVMEIVDFLKNPKKYTDLGGKIPKGALLVGPPGTGKTLLAKAVAGEAQVPFFSLSGSDFVEMFVGVGASRVRDLFKQAKEKAPCIVFIDEIDAIGRARGKNPMTGANDERENTLNQLLTEMDGFGSNQGVIILAATNRADILDRALLRAGRFDRQIQVELPDLEERSAIFDVHRKPLKIDSEVTSDFLAKQTPGFSGADIANVCNEAALIAARKNKKIIEKQDFLDAVDRIVGGLERRGKYISPDEKRRIAYHESGHATVSWMLKHAHPLVKVTIVPRGKALGAAWYLPEERQLSTREQILDEMCATLGGRASEEIFLGEISTGALNDLERVTKQAHAMCSIFGLNEKLGNISYYDSTGASDFAFTKPYSEKTAEVIDSEIHGIIEASYMRSKQILNAHQGGVDQLAERLMQREVIFREDMEEIFGLRPFPEGREVQQKPEPVVKSQEEKIQ